MVACFTKFIVDQSLDHRQLLVSLVELRPLIGSDLHRHRCEVLKPKTKGHEHTVSPLSIMRLLTSERNQLKLPKQQRNILLSCMCILNLCRGGVCMFCFIKRTS